MSDEAVRRLTDIEEIRQLKARYWRCLDTKDWSGFRAVFADDVHFEADTYSGDGADRIVSDISKNLDGAVTVHQGHTAEITITGPDTASGIWSFSDWVSHAPAAGAQDFWGHGHYCEEYMRAGDGWRIRASKVTRLRVDPA